MSQLRPSPTSQLEHAAATLANTLETTALFYFAATLLGGAGEAVLICGGALLAGLVGTDTSWMIYGLGVSFLLTNHLVALLACIVLRLSARATRRGSAIAPVLGALLASVLPAMEILLALPTLGCAGGMHMVIWLLAWSLGLSSLWRLTQWSATRRNDRD